MLVVQKWSLRIRVKVVGPKLGCVGVRKERGIHKRICIAEWLMLLLLRRLRQGEPGGEGDGAAVPAVAVSVCR